MQMCTFKCSEIGLIKSTLHLDLHVIQNKIKCSSRASCDFKMELIENIIIYLCGLWVRNCAGK